MVGLEEIFCKEREVQEGERYNKEKKNRQMAGVRGPRLVQERQEH